MSEVRKWMEPNTANTETVEQLLEGLNTWSFSGDMHDSHEGNVDWNAFNVQNEVGWHNLMMGLGVKEWAEMQQQYLTETNRRTTGKRWLIALLEKLILVSWDMWDHRNGIRHAPGNHRMELASAASDIAVVQELEAGFANLPASAARLFESNAAEMKLKSRSQKQLWSVTVESHRKFSVGIDVTELPPELSHLPERSMLRKWIETGRF